MWVGVYGGALRYRRSADAGLVFAALGNLSRDAAEEDIGKTRITHL